MDRKIAVLAPGAIGAPVGGLLTKAGHDVALIDQWPAHVDAMKANGLRITMGTAEDPYYTLGELDGRVTPRLEELVQILRDAGKAMISTDVLATKWTKLVLNSQASIASLCNTSSWELIDDPRYLPAVAQITREAMQIGVALGYKLAPIAGMTAENLLGEPERVARNLIENSKRGSSRESTTMVQHDVVVGRPSEVGGYLNGLLVHKGREAHVPTPMNEAIVALHQRMERGELPWDVSNLDLVPKSP